ncbi:MAG: hypothetical protein HBSIN02_17210 [Bacteroidia bacterium]|nr:MAG: hypothetical protein HBSIN02_17210 [Bacteroidia bacterium]
MLDKRTYDLLNQEMDGTNSPRDSKRVREILERNKAAREVYAELKKLSATLRNVPKVDPPRSLKLRILNSLPRPSAATPSFWDRLSDFVRIPVLRTAYTFVGGAVAGIVLFLAFSGTPPDSSGLAGTIGHSAEVSARVDLPEVSGSIRGQVVDGTIQVQGSLQSGREFTLRVLFPPADARFVRSTADQPSTLEVSPGQVLLAARNNLTTTLSFVSDHQTPTMTVQILVDGTTRFEQRLVFEPERQTDQSH